MSNRTNHVVLMGLGIHAYLHSVTAGCHFCVCVRHNNSLGLYFVLRTELKSEEIILDLYWRVPRGAFKIAIASEKDGLAMQQLLG